MRSRRLRRGWQRGAWPGSQGARSLQVLLVLFVLVLIFRLSCIYRMHSRLASHAHDRFGSFAAPPWQPLTRFEKLLLGRQRWLASPFVWFVSLQPGTRAPTPSPTPVGRASCMTQYNCDLCSVADGNVNTATDCLWCHRPGSTISDGRCVPAGTACPDPFLLEVPKGG